MWRSSSCLRICRDLGARAASNCDRVGWKQIFANPVTLIPIFALTEQEEALPRMALFAVFAASSCSQRRWEPRITSKNCPVPQH